MFGDKLEPGGTKPWPTAEALNLHHHMLVTTEDTKTELLKSATGPSFLSLFARFTAVTAQ